MFLALWNGERHRTAWVRGHPDRMQRYAPSWKRGLRPLGRSTRAGRPRSVSVHISPGSAGILPAGRPRSVSVHISPGSAGILPAGHPRSRVCPVVGARAAYPRPLHVGGTPALPGACVPPGANSYLAPWQTSQNGNERPCTVQSVPPDLISALSSQSAVLTTKRRTAVLGSQFSVLGSQTPP